MRPITALVVHRSATLAGKPFRAADIDRWHRENGGGGGIGKPHDPFNVAMLLGYSDRILLWGAHKFAERLSRGRWLAWDKVPTGKVRDQGDGEMAWTNVAPDAVTRFYRLLCDGVCVGAAAWHEVAAGQRRVHPTQKPQALMA